MPLPAPRAFHVCRQRPEPTNERAGRRGAGEAEAGGGPSTASPRAAQNRRPVLLRRSSWVWCLSSCPSCVPSSWCRLEGWLGHRFCPRHVALCEWVGVASAPESGCFLALVGVGGESSQGCRVLVRQLKGPSHPGRSAGNRCSRSCSRKALPLPHQCGLLPARSGLTRWTGVLLAGAQQSPCGRLLLVAGLDHATQTADTLFVVSEVPRCSELVVFLCVYNP